MTTLASAWDLHAFGGEGSGVEREPLPIEDDDAIVRLPHAEQDITVLPARLRRLAGKGQEERIVAAWEAELHRWAVPPGTQIRWSRMRSGKHGTKGKLVLEKGLPICQGLKVVVRGTPHDERDGNGAPKRKYPTYPRTALKDRTPLRTTNLAWIAYRELQADVAELEEAAALLASKSGTAVAGQATAGAGLQGGSATRKGLATMWTRGGRPLAGAPARYFSDDDKTYGAVIARMEAAPLKRTTHGLILKNRLIARRVLYSTTRLDLLAREDFQNVYDELGNLRKLRRQASAKGELIEGDELICSATRNGLWAAFVACLAYAEREGWLQNKAQGVEKEPSVNRDETRMLSREETLRFEDYVVDLAREAKTAVHAGVAPQNTPQAGVIPSHWSTWAGLRLQGDDMAGAAQTAIKVSRVGQVPIVQLPGGARYFATGLAAYVLMATALGPRSGELNALCWDSVDLDAGTIKWERHILGSDQQRPGGRRVQIALGTKTSRGEKIDRRTVRITERLHAALVAWRAERAELWLAMGWQIPEAAAGGVVFPSTGGKVLDSRAGREIWIAAERAAGVAATKQHTVRHAISTHNALARINPVVTAAVLGHSVKVEMKWYVKFGMEVPNEFAAVEDAWREQMQNRSVES